MIDKQRYSDVVVDVDILILLFLVEVLKLAKIFMLAHVYYIVFS